MYLGTKPCAAAEARSAPACRQALPTSPPARPAWARAGSQLSCRERAVRQGSSTVPLALRLAPYTVPSSGGSGPTTHPASGGRVAPIHPPFAVPTPSCWLHPLRPVPCAEEGCTHRMWARTHSRADCRPRQGGRVEQRRPTPAAAVAVALSPRDAPARSLEVCESTKSRIAARCGVGRGTHRGHTQPLHGEVPGGRAVR
jgi:hypothetical protein